MEQSFNKLSDKLINNLKSDEHLKISISGEHSQFVRFSQSKVRQSGIVDDVSLYMNLIKEFPFCRTSYLYNQ